MIPILILSSTFKSVKKKQKKKKHVCLALKTYQSKNTFEIPKKIIQEDVPIKLDV